MSLGFRTRELQVTERSNLVSRLFIACVIGPNRSTMIDWLIYWVLAARGWITSCRTSMLKATKLTERTNEVCLPMKDLTMVGYQYRPKRIKAASTESSRLCLGRWNIPKSCRDITREGREGGHAFSIAAFVRILMYTECGANVTETDLQLHQIMKLNTL